MAPAAESGAREEKEGEEVEEEEEDDWRSEPPWDPFALIPPAALARVPPQLLALARWCAVCYI